MKLTTRTLPLFLAGALLTVSLLISGYTLGVIQFPLETTAETDKEELVFQTEIDFLEEQIKKQDQLLTQILAQLNDLEPRIETVVEEVYVPVEMLVEVAQPAPATITQFVKRNDTIWTIAERFQKPPSLEYIQAIVDLNQVDPTKLQIGQAILIPLPETE